MSSELSSELYDVLRDDSKEALPRIRKLLEDGATEDMDLRTLAAPLCEAARAQPAEVVHMLLDKGAPVNAMNGFDMTPLSLAV